MGSSYAGYDHDDLYALLDMGQGIEVCSGVRPSPTHLLISDWKTGSTVQKGETFVTSSSRLKEAMSPFRQTGAHDPSPRPMSSMIPSRLSNSTTILPVTSSRTRNKMRIGGRLLGSPLVRSSISMQQGRGFPILSLGSLGSGLRFLKSS